ncbi:MAG: hypothetical protein AB4057_12710 [Crocosphaera sp.]
MQTMESNITEVKVKGEKETGLLTQNSRNEIKMIQELASAEPPIIAYESIIIQDEILPTINPFYNAGLSLPIVVDPGYAFCFLKTVNNQWTDNRRLGQRPLEGYSFDNETEFVKAANRAQLIGYDFNDNQWCGYEPRFDRSRNGTSYWINRSDYRWVIRWYMNDRHNGYSDNYGTANVDFLIWRF